MSSYHFFLILLINIAWGFNFLAAKTALDYFPPFLVLLLRFFLLLIILLPFLKIPKNKIFSVAFLSFISGVLYFSLNFVGLKLAGELTSPAIATQLFIPFGAILAFFFLREKVKLKTWVAILISFLGIMILAIINGLITSIILETIILMKQSFDFSKAFKTAIGMSFISMISMEVAMNLTDYFLTGGAILTWWVVPIMLLAGFVTPWPYNYWRLKKFGVACH